MARLQILELPESSNDDRPPFVLVIDQVSEHSAMFDAELGVWPSFKADTGCRHILVTTETIHIHVDKTVRQAVTPPVADSTDLAEAKQLAEALEEARSWARHGYEIGQKHCGWTDHGVVPDWLTEGWPRAFDTCEHLKQMAEFDEALTRVRNVPTEPEFMAAQQEHPSVWRHGYHCGVLAAKSAIRPRSEKAST